MTANLTGPAPTVRRDRYGRPYIIPPGGGKPVTYTRATTVADTLDDRVNRELWKMRQVAVGLADRPDLLLAVTAHRDEKKRLDKICEQALEAAKGSAGATTGTAIHALTELIDRGQDLPVVPDAARADLEAYRAGAQHMRVLAVEQMVVLDDEQVAGTADRIVEVDGRRYIADLKTGSTVDFSWGSIAQQLAIYSRGLAYDPATGAREPTGVDQDRAIVVHLPAGRAQCHLWWVRIDHGWEAARLALRVRAYRRHARSGLAEPLQAQQSSRRSA
jgi:hypothetical protein